MKAKSDASVSMGKEVASVTLAANPETLTRLEPALADLREASVADALSTETGEALAVTAELAAT